MSNSDVETLHSIVAGRETPGTGGSVRAVDPVSGSGFGPGFTLLSESEVALATRAAEEAFAAYRALAPSGRAAFLEAVAAEIDAAGSEIVAVAGQETGLPGARLTGELARTVGQLRMFAGLVGSGDQLGVRIEPPLPDRAPVPRPDLRAMRLPLGPVAVFGASNFPLAFSVAGGDTASALAAGCPVVFKAHNAHPGTAHLVGAAVTRAVSRSGLPAGVFSLVYGRGSEVGQVLVADPCIKAVGFTGSRSGGTALMATAAARREPIPVYAEMSSVNPVVVLPGALAARAAELAEGFVASLTGSAGQLCTAPGLLFVPEGASGDALVARIAELIAAARGLTMLTPGIRRARVEGEERLAGQPGVELLARGAAGEGPNAPAPAVYTTDVASFAADPALSEEVFGSVCLVVRHRSQEELLRTIRELEGQLTTTLHLDADAADDLEAARRLLPVLELGAGRVLANGWPTGVDVGDAMVHGGPFPATSDGRSTSVGTAAVERFLRPVVYQNMPAALLSAALGDENRWGLTRRVDGRFAVAGG